MTTQMYGQVIADLAGSMLTLIRIIARIGCVIQGTMCGVGDTVRWAVGMSRMCVLLLLKQIKQKIKT